MLLGNYLKTPYPSPYYEDVLNLWLFCKCNHFEICVYGFTWCYCSTHY